MIPVLASAYLKSWEVFVKKFYFVPFCFMVLALISLVGCFGGGDGDSYNYAASPANNPAPAPVPGAKVLPNANLNLPEVQVQQAVVESIKTLENSFRLNVAPQTDLRAAALPSGIPGFSGTQPLNLQVMMNYLLASLPTGGNINDGVFIDSTNANAWSYQVATYTESTKTLEIAKIQTYPEFVGNVWQQKKVLKNTQKFIGCEATVASGFLSSFKALAGTTFENKDYDKNGNVSETVTIKLLSGAQFELTQTLTDGNDTFVPWMTGSVYGYIIKATGKEKTTVTFTGPANFEVTLNNVDGTNANGKVTLSGLSGSYAIEGNFQVRQQAMKSGETVTVDANSIEFKEWIDGDIHTNQFAFANNQLTFGFSANYINEKISLENGQIIMNNITKKPAQANKADADYSFSNGTGSMLVKYSGSDYAKYGYIYSLAISMKNLAFDIDNPDNAGEGSVIEINKTNSDNSVNKLTYKIVDGKPVLQPGENTFAGGSEKVTVDEAKGETKVEGKVNVAAKADANEDETLKIEFASVKKSTGLIEVRVVVTLGTVKKTMYFTRKTDKSIDDGQVFDGEVAEKTGTTFATFAVATNGNGTLTLTSDSTNHTFTVEN